MEVVLGHWDSWEDGSLIIGQEKRPFADPTKVKRLDHNGAFFKSRGRSRVRAIEPGPSRRHPGRGPAAAASALPVGGAK